MIEEKENKMNIDETVKNSQVVTAENGVVLTSEAEANEAGLEKPEDVEAYVDEAARNLEKIAEEEEKKELQDYVDEAAKSLEKLAEEEEEKELQDYVDEAAKNLEKLAEAEEEKELEDYVEEAAGNLEKIAEAEEEKELQDHVDEAAKKLEKTAEAEDEKEPENHIGESDGNHEKIAGEEKKGNNHKKPSENKNHGLEGDTSEKSGISSRNSKKAEASPYDEDKPKNHKVLWIILAVVVGIILLAYVGGIIFFSQHFGANSTVNDVDCSFMTAEEVEKIISDQVEEYSLTIIERKDSTETIEGTAAGLEYVPDGQVKQLIIDQNALIWPYRFLAKDLAEQNTYTSVKIDEDKFIEVLDGLKCLDESQMIAPVDSYPYLDGNIYIAYPEEEGTTIADVDEATRIIREAILGTRPEINLEELGLYKDPVLTDESPEVTDVVNKYNEYIGLTITYHFGDETEVLDGATTNAWFTWDENMVPTLNKDAVKAWTREFGIAHDTVGTERTFTNPAGVEITVKGGIYGWSVDEDAEYDMILQMYETMQSQDREPVWEQTAVSFDEQDFGNTYIEVNLTTQHMIFWKEGEIIFENDVVTGLPTAEKETPQGVWYILEKKQNKIMRGALLEDGTYEYETPCSYWMRVTWTGVGFHDATWQASFGGNAYTYRGSHGCINMSYSGAQTLYGLVEVGTPVIIYKNK